MTELDNFGITLAEFAVTDGFSKIGAALIFDSIKGKFQKLDFLASGFFTYCASSP